MKTERIDFFHDFGDAIECQVGVYRSACRQLRDTRRDTSKGVVYALIPRAHD